MRDTRQGCTFCVPGGTKGSENLKVEEAEGATSCDGSWGSRVVGWIEGLKGSGSMWSTKQRRLSRLI